MNTTLTHDDCYVLFKASQNAWNSLQVIKNNRLYQLEMLYITMKEACIIDLSIDPIMAAIAILDEKKCEKRIQHLALIQAHANAVDALKHGPAGADDYLPLPQITPR